MKRVKLDENYVANVVEGSRARLEKATKRGLDPAQVQALSNFAEKIRTTIDEHRDTTSSTTPTPTTPSTPNSKLYTADLTRRVEIQADLLSAIVARVLKHRSETPRLLESTKASHKKPQGPTPDPLPSTSESQAKNENNVQIESIFIFSRVIATLFISNYAMLLIISLHAHMSILLHNYSQENHRPPLPFTIESQVKNEDNVQIDITLSAHIFLCLFSSHQIII